MELDPLVLSRAQLAFVIAFRIVFPAFTVGLASYIAMLEGMYLVRRDDRYLRASKFWLRIFAVSFGMGVVSGIVMPFQFGTNWASFSDKVANVVGPLLAYEGPLPSSWRRGFSAFCCSAAFFVGSVVAAFSQGAVLGSYVHGFSVLDGRFAGTSWDWMHPFVLVTGVGVVAGYALLGATWLVLKTEGPLQAWARRQARRALAATGIFIAAVSLYSPFVHPRVHARWFAESHWIWLAPLPLATLAVFWLADRSLRGARSQAGPFVASLGIFTLCFAGLAVSLFPYVVPQVLLAGCRRRAPQPGFPARRNAAAPAGDPGLHGLVVLGVPRQGAGGHRLLMTIE